MSGYLRADRPGIVQPPEEGWHDTGDIVHIDDEGFVTIVGRAKRFAKIAGEMVSLAVAERIASAAYPDWRHAVVALPDARRGERLVLVTEAPAIRRDALIEAAQRERLPELAIPRDIVAGCAAAARLREDRLSGGAMRLAAEAGRTDRTEAVAG